MRAAGQAAVQVLVMLGEHVRAGVTTGELDRISRDFILGPLGCQSATIGYTAGGSRPPFPGAICTSVNHVVCHGIPGDKALRRTATSSTSTSPSSGRVSTATPAACTTSANPACSRAGWSERTHEAMILGIRQVRPGARSATSAADPGACREPRLLGRASTAAMASAAAFTRTRRSSTTAGAARVWSWCRNVLHGRADAERGQAGYP